MASLFSMSKTKFKLFGLLSVFTLITGCDDDGDSIGPKPDISVSGQAMKGSIVGAPVNIYRAKRDDGTIPSVPHVQGAVKNLYTNSNGEYSYTLDGDDYRNRTLVVEVGVAICTTSRTEYVEANSGCTNTDGSTVEVDEKYFIGEYRCDDVNGCEHPESGAEISFGNMLPIDFSLRSVIPLLSNSDSVRSQTANVSALTTLAAAEMTQVLNFTEISANAIHDKIARVFQLDGINILTQPMVDVANLSTSVTNTNTWLLSSVNAGIMVTASRPETGARVTFGTGLGDFQGIFLGNGDGGQLVYNYSASNDNDLESIYGLAQSITNHGTVTGFVSATAKQSLTDIETDINAQPADQVTEEQISQDILDEIDAQSEVSQNFIFDFTDWYSEQIAEGTDAYTRFEYMMDSLRIGSKETIPHMETLGNDFTLVLAAALDQMLDDGWDGSAFTLNSVDKDNVAVVDPAVLTRSGSEYSIEGNYLHTEFDLTFTYTETTNDDGVMPENPPEGEEDDKVYRFDIETDDSEANYEAENEGLTLNFQQDVSISLQVDSLFDGTEATVVRSSFAWGDILLAQTNSADYDVNLGRITLDGQLVFSMEHVADDVLRYNATYDDTETFTVPRVDNREFVFLQFGSYNATFPSNSVPSKFQVTVSDVPSVGGAGTVTWPISFLFGARTHLTTEDSSYSAEAFGSFDSDYLAGNGADQWGSNDCDFLPYSYALIIDENDSDSDTYNDIPVTLPDADGVEQDLVYSISFVSEKQQIHKTALPLKDTGKLCSVTFNSNDVATDVNYYKAKGINEAGRYLERNFTYIGAPNLSNYNQTFFVDGSQSTQPSAQISYDDCLNNGSVSGISGGVSGRLYKCDVPVVGEDDYQCFQDGLYTDFTTSALGGKRIERQEVDGVDTIVEVDGDYQACSDGSDWEVRYLDGSVIVLPVDLDVLGPIEL